MTDILKKDKVRVCPLFELRKFIYYEGILDNLLEKKV